MRELPPHLCTSPSNSAGASSSKDSATVQQTFLFLFGVDGAADGGDDREDTEHEQDEDGQDDLQVDLPLRNVVGDLVLEVLPASAHRNRRVSAHAVVLQETNQAQILSRFHRQR